MTTARAAQVDLNTTPYYHCITRCVRRAYLCGTDRETGQDYSHRKLWIVNRIKHLSTIFAIKICAYAVMSNHYHLVLYVNIAQASNWSDQEVKAQWALLFPRDAQRLETFITSGLSQEKIQEKILLWRERLMDISWFMRALNEVIARQANIEDNCKGRFWEARFKSQALLDEGAVLSAMAYVDLNPIRANIVNTPEESDFTSIHERIQHLSKQLKQPHLKQHCNQLAQPAWLMPLNAKMKANDACACVNFNLSDYLELLDYSGRVVRNNKCGAIPSRLSPILMRLNLTGHGWLKMVKTLEHDFSCAIGHEDRLKNFAPFARARSPKGKKFSKECYLKLAI